MKPSLNDLGIVGQRIPNFQADKCKGCKKCKVSAACPMKACQVVDGVLQMDKTICNNCGRCIGNCIFDALEDGAYGYQIYLGGRWGKKSHQGRLMSRILTDEAEVIAVIEKAILLFRDQGITGERFADTITRLGMENVEAQLLSDDLLNRKEEILAAELKK